MSGVAGKVWELSLNIVGGLLDMVPKKRDFVVVSKLELPKLFAFANDSEVLLQKPNEVAQELDTSMHTKNAHHRETFIALSLTTISTKCQHKSTCLRVGLMVL